MVQTSDIPTNELLEYNLKDTLATWYVYNKNKQKMIADEQEGIYKDIQIKRIKLILQMELTGVPLNANQVQVTKAKLLGIRDRHTKILAAEDIIILFTEYLKQKACDDANAKLKTKIKPLSDFDDVKFNPNSNKQLQELLYTTLGLPVIDVTDSKAPATGGKTIKKLVHHTSDEKVLAVLNSIIGVAEVAGLLNTFISAFERAVPRADGRSYLYGNFNIGGTVSGRLSSSSPNLQNMPSTGNFYAKDVKNCVEVPKGKLLVGIDYNSLEDYISALTTRDPNKLKVYVDEYDGHCLRAFSYFKDRLPGIVDTVKSINSIATIFPDVRQDSKGPTFTLTYGGTYVALMDAGLSEMEAKAIEGNYHKLYVHSDKWVETKIKQASIDGYVTVAFGLRVRTPILKQTMLGHRSTPFEAQAEGRTAGNTLGQSYGLLNNRAGIEFQERTLASEYRTKILPIMHIHDAQYFIIDDDIDTLHWFNKNVVECVQWQELPELKHDIVKLGGAVDVFYPTWANAITIPNSATKSEIYKSCSDGLEKFIEGSKTKN